MSRKLKALGLALVASLALSVVAASTAQAIEFHSSAENTTLMGSQVGNHEWTVGSGFGAIKCKTATFAGTAKLKTESTELLTPVYKECTDSLGRIVHITASQQNKFTPPTSMTGLSVEHREGELTISITSGGKQICHVLIKTQTSNGIGFHNAVNSGTSRKHLVITTNTTNTVSITIGGFFNCGLPDGAHTGGSYTGTTTLSGTAGGVPVDIWVE